MQKENNSLCFLFCFSRNMAWLTDAFLGVITALPGLMVVVFVFVYAAISSLWATLCGGLLKWVTSPLFIQMPYTRPGSIPNGNPIIEAGLSITQGFVNMLLVLILVYIAIATILRLAGYETKKLLITFIIVALLVNFAPVVCGLVVDTSNIIMNFFLGEISGGRHLIANLNNLWEVIKIEFVGLKSFSTSFIFTERLEVIFKVGVIGTMNLFLGLLLLLFACIFIFRYIAIWMLVILSPLAFACYILPATKKYWTMWWNQLIQWSFIGVTCAFFLYLADLLANLGTQIYGSSAPMVIGDRILPYLVPMGFLMIALVFGLQTSAIGASTVMSLSKRGGRWAAGKTWKGMALADRKLIPALSKDEKGKRRLKFTTARHTTEGITKAWDRTKFLRWFRPEPLRKFSEFRGAMEEAKKQNTGPSDIGMERLAYGKLAPKEAAAWLDTAVRDRGDSQDFVKVYAKKYGYWDKKTKKVDEEGLFKDKKFLNDKYALKAINFMSKTGNLGKVLRIDPRLAKIGRSEKEGRKKMIESIINAKPADIANMEREVIDNEEVMEILMAVGGENQLRAVGNLKGGVMARQDTVNNVVSKWVEKEKLDPAKEKENWGKFIKQLGKKYNVLEPGIAKAITNPRFRSSGWGYTTKEKEFYGAKYRDPDARKTPSGTSVGAVVLGKAEKEVEALRRMGEGGEKEIKGRRPGGLMPDRKKPPKGRRP